MVTNKKTDQGDFDALFYAGTQTLINRFGEKDAGKLAKLERDFSALAALDARLKPVKGDFDLAHMQAIHTKIFSEVYPWAGQIRDYPIFKKRPDGLVTEFARPDEITKLDQRIKALMQETKNFTSLKPNEFPEKIARVYQIANEMHPFREGNGRTQRIYLDYLASQVGYKLDFKLVDKEAWNYAASMSGKVNLGGDRIDGRTDELEKLFKHISKGVEKATANAYAQGRAAQTTRRAGIMTLADLNPKLAAEKKASYRV